MIVWPRQTGQMEYLARVDHVEAEGRRLIAAASSDLSAAVPTCPDWKSVDLLAHTAQVWRFMDTMVTSLAPDPSPLAGLTEVEPDVATVVDVATTNLAALCASLRSADPEAAVWTWSTEQTVAFYARRAQHETVVHRVDAESAAGTPTSLDGDVAVDGIDELLTVLIGPGGEPRPSGSFHLHRTDGDGEFMLTVDGERLVVAREHGKGDAALRATGEELFLVMWGRRGLDGLELFGDEAVAQQWIDLSP